jgi:hypothetical protein
MTVLSRPVEVSTRLGSYMMTGGLIVLSTVLALATVATVS